jgi:hypothetical protein
LLEVVERLPQSAAALFQSSVDVLCLRDAGGEFVFFAANA